MLLQRIITAVISIPLLIAAIVWGGELVFLFLVLVFGAVGLYEFFRAALPEEHYLGKALGIALGIFILSCVFIESREVPAKGSGAYFLTLAGCTGSILVLFLYHILNARDMVLTVNRLSLTVFGVFYISLFFSYLLLLNTGARGPSFILFLLFVTWAGDAASYFIGSWKGRRLLCPGISPKKTIEGAVGGLLGGVITALACDFLLLKGASPLGSMCAGAGINIMNQFGDLGESVLKRAFGIKDSGGVFPGHGGVLDRLDSLLFAAPFFYFWVTRVFPE
jgi:phosphatidate cytidylyltransferase